MFCQYSTSNRRRYNTAVLTVASILSVAAASAQNAKPFVQPTLQYINLKANGSSSFEVQRYSGKFDEMDNPNTLIDNRTLHIAAGSVLRAFTSDGQNWYSVIRTNGNNCFARYSSLDNFVAQKVSHRSCISSSDDTLRGLAADGKQFYTVNFMGTSHEWRTFTSFDSLVTGKANSVIASVKHSADLYKSIGYDPIEKVFTTVASWYGMVYYQKFTTFADMISNSYKKVTDSNGSGSEGIDSFKIPTNGVNFVGSAIGPIDKTLDVFVVAGQSNAVGYTASENILTSLSTSADQNADSKVRFYYNVGHNVTSVDTSTSFLGTLGPQNLWGNPIFGIERGALRTIAKAGRSNLAVVKVAFGSTGFGQHWNISNKDSGILARRLIDELSKATDQWNKQGFRTRIAGIFWMQGEEDGKNATNANSYQTNLTNFVKVIRDVSEDSCTPFVLGRIKLNPEWPDPTGTTVRLAQVNVAKTIGCADWVDTDGYTMGDRYHYDTASTLRLGNEMAQRYLRLIGH